MILITCPHGHPDDDKTSLAVARAIFRNLPEAKLLVWTESRNKLDMNRPEARVHPWRQQVAKAIQEAEFLIDVHSFPADDDRYNRWEMVTLWTSGVQLLPFLYDYADAFGHGASVQQANRIDDIVTQAHELGLPMDKLLLAEHREDVDTERLGEKHAEVILDFLGGE